MNLQLDQTKEYIDDKFAVCVCKAVRSRLYLLSDVFVAACFSPACRIDLGTVKFAQNSCVAELRVVAERCQVVAMVGFSSVLCFQR